MEEDRDFRLYQKGIEFIQKEIVESPVALTEWPMCINSFVTNACSRRRLRDEYKNGQFEEVMLKTLEEWIEKQSDKATLGALIQLLRSHNLNNLCGLLEEMAEDIKRIQSTSTTIIENGSVQNFWFGMTDVPNFVGRVEDLETIHKFVTENRDEEHDSLALLTSVHGCGGIGKTSLARMYAWKYRNYFDGNVIWIDSEKLGSMRAAFQDVAEELHLKFEATNLDLNHLTKSVYNAFGDSKCLFIFDNAEEFNGQNGVAQFLPSGIIRKPYLLLTSRRNDCFSTNRILELGVLSQSDSVKLVKKYIPNATNEIADKLAERLDRVPLAIQQAIAYINKVLGKRFAEDDALNTINSFLQEYENYSNRILNSEFIGIDGYTKNICSICEMSLQKMEHEEGGNLAKHMLRYISFLNPDNIYLDLVLNLPYQFEGVWNKLRRIITWSTEKMDPNITLQLLCSYSLIDINTKEKTIKVHRLVQDAIRFMLLENEELPYVKRLIAGLNEQAYSKRFSHWISIKGWCRFSASKNYFKNVIPDGVIELMELLNSAGLNIDLSKKLVNLANKHSSGSGALSLISPILKAMKCNNINESVENFLNTYFKIESAFEEIGSASLMLTNYTTFGTFIIPEGQTSVFQSVIECISVLRIRACKRTLLLELVGTSYPPEDVNVVLDIISQSGIAVMSGAIFELGNFHDVLFVGDLEIPESLCNEFPCLNYLKSSTSFSSIDELQALSLSWDFKNSIIWPLLNNLEFNLEAVRSAIAYICYAGCTIAKYIENYKATFKVEKEYKELEIIVQIVNAKLLRNFDRESYKLLTHICCLPPELSVPKRFIDLFDVYLYNIYSKKNCRMDLQILANLRFTEKNRTFFMNRNLQIALRKSVLSFLDKNTAVIHLHRACNPAYNEEPYDEICKYWRELIDPEDLRELALKFNCSPYK